MKLAEAAHILGISLEEVTVNSLKQAYKGLMANWDNEKIKDTSTRFRFLQINEAYQKLHSVMESKDEPLDDQRELANFMKMVMDIVGISDSNSIPSAMTFGMMFSSRRQSNNGGDEWSTDDELDHDDHDDVDEDDDEYDQNSEENDIWPSLLDHADQWEPQAKQYSNMNLKAEVCKARQESEKSVVEDQRRLKLAKKRAEKRKKQKERRKMEEQSHLSIDDEHMIPNPTTLTSSSSAKGKSPEVLQFENILAMANSAESIERIVNRQKEQHRQILFDAIQKGDVETVRQLLQFNTSHEKIPQSILESVYSAWKSEFSSYFLLHRCITDTYQFVPEDLEHGRDHILDILPDTTRGLIQKKVQIAQLFLNCKDPLLDANAYDDQGLSILHKSIVVGDLEFARFVVNVIVTCSSTVEGNNQSNTSASSGERRITINLNTRCRKRGWAPIHYAVDRSNLEAIRLLGYAGANLQATSATDKKLTPLELIKSRLKSQQQPSKANNHSNQTSSNSSKAVSSKSEAFTEVLNILTELISWQKSLGKEEKRKASAEAEAKLVKEKESKTSSKKAEAVSTSSAPLPSTPTPTATSATVNASTSAKSEKKKKKKKAEGGDVSKTLENSPAQSSTPERTSNPLIPLVASRDEIVDRLLAMGFKEADCLRAIAKYGTDIDQAISFLCERPAVSPSPQSSSNPPATAPANTNQPNQKKDKEKTGKTSKSKLGDAQTPVAASSNATNVVSQPVNSTKSGATTAKTVTPTKRKEPAVSTAGKPLPIPSSPAVPPPPPGLEATNATRTSASSPSNYPTTLQTKAWAAAAKASLSDDQDTKEAPVRILKNESNRKKTVSPSTANKAQSSPPLTGRRGSDGELSKDDVNSSPRLTPQAQTSGLSTDFPSLTTPSLQTSHVIPGYVTAASAQQSHVPINTLSPGIAYPLSAAAGPLGVYYTSPYAININTPAVPPGYAISPAILVPGYPANLSPMAYHPVVQSSLVNGAPSSLQAAPQSSLFHAHGSLDGSIETSTSSFPQSSVVLSNMESTIVHDQSGLVASSNEAVNETSDHQDLFGALELSVGAKPFVPKSFPSSSQVSTSPSHIVSPLLSGGSPSSSDILSNLGANSTPNGYLFEDHGLASSKTSLESGGLGRSLGINGVSGVTDAWSNTVLSSNPIPSLNSVNNTLSPSSSLGNVTSLGDSFGSLGATPLGGLGVSEGIGGLGSYFGSGLFSGLNGNVGSVGAAPGLGGAGTFEFDVNHDILPDLDSLLAKDLNDLTT